MFAPSAAGRPPNLPAELRHAIPAVPVYPEPQQRGDQQGYLSPPQFLPGVDPRARLRSSRRLGKRHILALSAQRRSQVSQGFRHVEASHRHRRHRLRQEVQARENRK